MSTHPRNQAMQQALRVALSALEAHSYCDPGDYLTVTPSDGKSPAQIGLNPAGAGLMLALDAKPAGRSYTGTRTGEPMRLLYTAYRGVHFVGAASKFLVGGENEDDEGTARVMDAVRAMVPPAALRSPADVLSDLQRAVDWDAIHDIHYADIISPTEEGRFGFRCHGRRWTITAYRGQDEAAEACMLAAGLVRDFTGADGQVLISADPERPLPAGLEILYRADGVRE